MRQRPIAEEYASLAREEAAGFMSRERKPYVVKRLDDLEALDAAFFGLPAKCDTTLRVGRKK
jgi:hypothetical protein